MRDLVAGARSRDSLFLFCESSVPHAIRRCIESEVSGHGKQTFDAGGDGGDEDEGALMSFLDVARFLTASQRRDLPC